MQTYYCYILTNSNRTVLYTGVTNDLGRRVGEHKVNKNGNKSFTSRYKVTNLIYFEEFDNPSDAIMREKIIKGWIRRKKEALITAQNPEWRFLDFPW